MRSNYDMKAEKSAAKIEKVQNIWKKMNFVAILLSVVFIISLTLYLFFENKVCGTIANASLVLALVSAIAFQLFVVAGRGYYLDYSLEKIPSALIWLFVLLFFPLMDGLFFALINNLFQFIPNPHVRGEVYAQYLDTVRLGALACYIILLTLSIPINLFFKEKYPIFK